MDSRTSAIAHLKIQGQSLVAEITAPILPVIGVFAVESIGKSMERFIDSFVDYVDASCVEASEEIRF